MISFRGWQSIDINFFKMFRSCLFKRSLIETGNEIKRRLWHRSKKFYITVRSDSDAPYTESAQLKLGKTIHIKR